jgi:hypothetical protein
MTQCYIQDAEGPCSCANCDWKGDAEKLDMITDIQERITAGGVVPAGQCPECGALAYLDKTPDWAKPEPGHWQAEENVCGAWDIFHTDRPKNVVCCTITKADAIETVAHLNRIGAKP